MKGLINLKNIKKENTEIFAHIDYHASKYCKNEKTDFICHKCGNCGRKFNKLGIKIS